ncbi:MAG: cyclohexa-1,5-dienecarbonyl-CoA hydratase, partial [Proteobacteria bacterium]|nr:cyclohexa-1,5-dienecarbonyl-CoA hydratase [Pseudomonadota bacterium]
MSSPIKTKTERDGAVERIILAQPKGNILDAVMLAALREKVLSLASRPEVKLLVFEGEGKHFSFGASVEEHMPESVGEMLSSFHGLFRDIESIGIPTAAVVRGQCLGGGFELATWCGWVCCDSS